ncbi:MAG: GNAT family N-acetyltransferase [bacterium]
MNIENYVVRKMKKEEANLAIEWASDEGWNPGLYDLDCFWNTDPDGWWIGLLNNEPICLKTAIKYGNTYGFMGFYMVKPKFRGKGYGLTLWKIANESLIGRIAGMDGVVEQQKNYAKSGYVYAHRNVRYEGVGGGQTINAPNITDIKNISFELIENYDRECFPEKRSKFLTGWFSLPESFSLGYFEDGKIKGFGTIRKCRKGYKIGPLFSDNYQIAEKLFLCLKSKINEGESFYLDIPEPNENAVKLVKKYNMKYVFETARMYLGGTPDVNLNKIYGITTFELG